MTKVYRNITRRLLDKIESQFISKMVPKLTFSIDEPRQVLGQKVDDPTRQFLKCLQRKGWIQRIRLDKFSIIPLSPGEERYFIRMNSYLPWKSFLLQQLLIGLVLITMV